MERVLLVDDDQGTLDIFEGVLCREGFRVFTAQSGQQALDCTRRMFPHIVLADLRLPDFSGVDLLRRLRSEGFTSSVIIMTGYGTVASAVEATKLGAIDYLEKPLSDADIVQAVKRALTSALSADEGFEKPAAARWAALVMAVVHARSDPTTLAQWAKTARIARATLLLRCHAATLSPKASLDFARVLRTLVVARRLDCRPEALLECDPRTLRRLFAAASEGANAIPGRLPTVMDFLQEQRFIDDSSALEAVSRCLATNELE